MVPKQAVVIDSELYSRFRAYCLLKNKKTKTMKAEIEKLISDFLEENKNK